MGSSFEDGTSPTGAKIAATREQVETLIDLGRLDQAESSARRLIAASPDEPGGWEVLARCLIDAGRSAESLEALATALSLDPQSGQSWYLKAFAHMHLGKHQLAVDAAGKAAEIDPNEPRFHLGLAEANRQLYWHPPLWQFLQPGRRRTYREASEAAAARAVELDPSSEKALRTLAGAKEDCGDDEGALALYGRALEASPDDPRNLFSFGSAAIKNGDTRAGSECLIAAAKLDPTLAPSVARVFEPTSGKYVALVLGACSSLIIAITAIFMYFEGNTAAVVGVPLGALAAIWLGMRAQKIERDAMQWVPEDLHKPLREVLSSTT